MRSEEFKEVGPSMLCTEGLFYLKILATIYLFFGNLVNKVIGKTQAIPDVIVLIVILSSNKYFSTRQ